MDVIQVNNLRSAPWAPRKFPPIWPNGVPTFKSSARDASTHFVARSEPCVPLGSVSKGPDMVFCSKVLVICSFSGRPKGARKRHLQQGLSRLATFGRAERVLRCNFPRIAFGDPGRSGAIRGILLDFCTLTRGRCAARHVFSRARLVRPCAECT